MQRESLNTRQGSKAGKIRVRTGREKMRLPPLRAKEKVTVDHIKVHYLKQSFQCGVHWDHLVARMKNIPLYFKS